MSRPLVGVAAHAVRATWHTDRADLVAKAVLDAVEYETLLAERDALVAERDWLRAEIEKPADVLNARDAVTEGDIALWEASPGDALARTVGELLDDLIEAQCDMHVLARRFNDLEAERNRYREALKCIARRTGVFDSEVAMAMARHARAALDGDS